jgi:tRNA threonylcarbamoyladenosine biosynthesis protein TsaB
MKLYLDTSTNICHLKIDRKSYEWDAGREMAEGLLKFIHDKLLENNADWKDISEIVYFSGPGSFTGLRIGAAVVNALASDLKIPLKDQNGELHDVIMPNYGKPANITPPKK